MKNKLGNVTKVLEKHSEISQAEMCCTCLRRIRGRAWAHDPKRLNANEGAYPQVFGTKGSSLFETCYQLNQFWMQCKLWQQKKCLGTL